MLPNLLVIYDVNSMESKSEGKNSPEVFSACAITRTMTKRSSEFK